MDLFGCGDGSMYSQAIASAQPRVRVMLFVIVFTEKVNAGSMEASSNVGGKVSSLDCALEIGRSKETSDDPLKEVYIVGGLLLISKIIDVLEKNVE